MIQAVPLAQDAVAWNAHRVYGRARLRLLLQGWKMECSLGLHPEVLDQPLANPQQPLLILTRRRQYEEQVGVGEGKGMGGERGEARERVCFLLVLNLVSSTLPCIRRP